jgi:two-component system chemotaxis sensor kinase CheA
MKAKGSLTVKFVGEIPKIGDFDPEICTSAWELNYITEMKRDELDSFFEFYTDIAQIEIECEEEAEEEQSSSETTPPTKEAEKKAPAKEETTKGNAPAQAAKSARTLRVDLDRVDHLVNMVGEIVITQAALAQTLTDEGNSNLDLMHAIDAMSRQTRELQESVMAIRAQPVKSVFSRMARLVRDLAQQLDKDAEAVISGEHTEVDTTVIEELAEPLIHMIRNAMDHGLESPEEREEAGKQRAGKI